MPGDQDSDASPTPPPGVGSRTQGRPAADPELDPDRVAASPGHPHPPEGAPASGWTVAWLVIGVVLVAVNLRAAVTSLGSLLEEVTTGLGMSPTVAGVVTMLPTLCFAVFGITTPWLARRLRPARILVAAMVMLAAGQALRAVTDSVPVFLICTTLALSGVAVANVLLPALVKQLLPHRIGLVTGAYTMSLIFGASAAAAASVPVAGVFGSWRAGLAAWALLASVAVLPWLPAALRGLGRPPAAPAGQPSVPAAVIRYAPHRTGLGWAMAIYFGAQSLNGYALMGWLATLFRDSGYSPANAGLLLAAVTAAGVPLAMIMPTLTVRLPDLRLLVGAVSVASTGAYLGLMLAPGAGLLWVVLLAAGQAAFPFILTLIGMRARTPEGTVALSAFTQSAGYLVAGLGPFLVGALYEWTGGWSAPLLFLIAIVVVQTAAGLVISRPRFIEDCPSVSRPRRG